MERFAKWLTQHEPDIANFVQNSLNVLFAVFGKIGDAASFVAQHKEVFLGVAAALAAIFVVKKISDAYAWAEDAIRNVQRVGGARRGGEEPVRQTVRWWGGAACMRAAGTILGTRASIRDPSHCP